MAETLAVGSLANAIMVPSGDQSGEKLLPPRFDVVGGAAPPDVIGIAAPPPAGMTKMSECEKFVPALYAMCEPSGDQDGSGVETWPRSLVTWRATPLARSIVITQDEDEYG
jgi:hypothetical protein